MMVTDRESSQGHAANRFAVRQILQQAPIPVPGPLIERVLHIEDLLTLHEQAKKQSAQPRDIFVHMLDLLQVRYEPSADWSTRIPKTGPVLIVANHPFGMLEGPIMADLMLKHRPDVKFMASFLLHAFDAIAPYVIPVNPFGGAAEANRRPVRDCLDWLKKGHCLIVFPAGEVSSWQMPELRVADPQWSATIARLARKSNATVVPVHINGGNGPAFHAAGVLHPRLRTALLPYEFFRKQGENVKLRIGRPVSPERMSHFPDDDVAIQYLRRRVYALAGGDNVDAPKIPVGLPWFKRKTTLEPLTDEIDPAQIERELTALTPLVEHNHFAVYVAKARQIPATLSEVGRLRELTFREVGEGSGNRVDLDTYDASYEHIILYDREARLIAGGYRLCRTSEALRHGGESALYTSTLFKFDPRFLGRLGNAIELGRSFVRPEYQRSYQPLLLLWKGIGRFILQHPDHPILFGPVSISAHYRQAAQEVIVAYLQAHAMHPSLSPVVKPRHAFKARPIASRELRDLARQISSLEELDDVISDADARQKGMPVLLRHYLQLGGQIIEFNLDASFGNCLDGLIMVDLRHTDRRLLERYMGKDGATEFLAASAGSTISAA